MDYRQECIISIAQGEGNTFHSAYCSYQVWDQFSCYMIVINAVAVHNLLPQITDMNDMSSADWFFSPSSLWPSSARNRLFRIQQESETLKRERLILVHQKTVWPKLSAMVTLSIKYESSKCSLQKHRLMLWHLAWHHTVYLDLIRSYIILQMQPTYDVW